MDGTKLKKLNEINLLSSEDEIVYKTIEIEKLQNMVKTFESNLNLQCYVIYRLINSDDLEKSAKKVLQILKKKLPGLMEISVLLYDENRGSLYVFASSGLSRKKQKAIFHPGEGISGRAFLYKKTIFTENAGKDPKFLNWLQNSSEYVNKAFIAIPLRTSDTVLGVLTACGATFPKMYQELLKTFASTLSPLIQLMVTRRERESQYYSLIEKLIDISESFNPVWRGHSHRVNRYSLYLSEKLKLDKQKIKIINHGSRLHDVGKLAIMDIVKKRGKLTKKEREILKLHPLMGEQFVRDFDFLVPAIPIIKFHHEWFDGTGYPGFYAGTQIPLEARIVSIADVFDAITGSRHYKKSLTFKQAIKELKRVAGSQLDPELVDLFTKNEKELKELVEKVKEQNFGF